MTSSVAYASAAEVFAAFNQKSQADAVQMTRIIKAVSRLIDGYMNREAYGFVALETAIPNVFAGTGLGWLYVPEFIGVPTVSMKTSLDSSSYDFSFLSSEILPFRGDWAHPNYNKTPYHGLLIGYASRRKRFTNGCLPDTGSGSIELPTVQVAAKWGHSLTVPDIIKEATIMQSERWYKREQSGMGDAVYNEQLGGFGFFKELDPEVKMMLDKSRLKIPTGIK